MVTNKIGSGDSGIDFEAAVGTNKRVGEVVVRGDIVEHEADGVDFEVDLGREGGVVAELEDAVEPGAHDVVVHSGRVSLGVGFGIADDGGVDYGDAG